MNPNEKPSLAPGTAAHDPRAPPSPRSQLRQQLQLTPVEETAAQILVFRWRASEAFRRPDGTPYFDGSYDKALVEVCMPPDKQAEALSQGPPEAASWMFVRTAEIDEQLLRALGNDSGGKGGGGGGVRQVDVQQVVIGGAGLDTRPWRLPLGGPGRCRVIELDSGAVERVKLAVLAPGAVGAEGAAAGQGEVAAAAAAAAEEEDPAAAAVAVGDPAATAPEGADGGRPLVLRLPTCDRVFARADLAQREQVLSALSAAGHNPALPTVFLLEGLIGYLTPAQGADLLSALRSVAAPGSTLLMSAPPTPERRDEAARRGQPLRHATFEEAEETMGRTRAAGWDVRLLSASDLGAKYGIPGNHFQLILGHPA